MDETAGHVGIFKPLFQSTPPSFFFFFTAVPLSLQSSSYSVSVLVHTFNVVKKDG